MSINENSKTFNLLQKKLSKFELTPLHIDVIMKEIEKKGVRRTLTSYKKKKEQVQERENSNELSMAFFDEMVKILEKLDKKDG